MDDTIEKIPQNIFRVPDANQDHFEKRSLNAKYKFQNVLEKDVFEI